MFTGIVESTGTINRTTKVPGGRRLRVEVGVVASECKHGDSICVSGVCLTVTTIDNGAIEFDVVTETLDKTTLGEKRVGDCVNIERSLRVGDRLDGHFVQGHIDGVATVEAVERTTVEHVVRFACDHEMSRFIIPKGSIAIDGVSLTIAAVRDASFSVALIPTTLERTTLGQLDRGDSVNVETDIIVRTIVHRLTDLRGEDGLTLEVLQKAGFA